MYFHLLLLAALASATLATHSEGSTILLPRHLHAFLPLEVRQGDVSPDQYACHEACGQSILKATGEYCQSTEWKGYYDSCMDCANDYGIWKWYGDKITAAAEQCGLDAVPDPADVTSAASSAAGETSIAATASSLVTVSGSVSSAVSSIVVPSVSMPAPVPTALSTLSETQVPAPNLPTISDTSISVPTAAATAIENMYMVAIGVAGMVALPAAL